MAAPTRHQGDHVFLGNVQMLDVDLPAGTITDADVAAGAEIATTKLRHRFAARLAESHATTAAAKTVPIHRVYGAVGSILDVSVALAVACSNGGSDDRSVTVDVQKNGVTVLSGTIQFTKADAAHTLKTGTLSVTALAADDRIDVVVTVGGSTGTLGAGLYVQVLVDEDPV